MPIPALEPTNAHPAGVPEPAPSHLALQVSRASVALSEASSVGGGLQLGIQVRFGGRAPVRTDRVEEAEDAAFDEAP